MKVMAAAKPSDLDTKIESLEAKYWQDRVVLLRPQSLTQLHWFAERLRQSHMAPCTSKIRSRASITILCHAISTTIEQCIDAVDRFNERIDSGKQWCPFRAAL